jgi:hypothetical protein
MAAFDSIIRAGAQTQSAVILRRPSGARASKDAARRCS